MDAHGERAIANLPQDADEPYLRTRTDWVDACRGLGIFLVVLGHTLRGLFHAQLLPNDGLWSFLDRAIYAFHMPLFFFLSGLFLVPSQEETWADFARRRIVRLGYPYLVWATLQTLVQIALSRYTNAPADLSAVWSIGFAPPMQFWFLYALLLQVLCIGLLWCLGFTRRTIFLFGVFMFVAAPFLPAGPVPLLQARMYLVYTCLGVACGAPGILSQLTRIPRGRLLALGLGGFAAVAVAVREGSVTARAAQLGLACLGTVAAVALCLFACSSENRGLERLRGVLVEWGRASLAIFVAHTLASAAVRIALQKLMHRDDPMLHLVLGTWVGLAFPLWLLELSKRFELPYLFEWPLPPRALPVPPRPSHMPDLRAR